MTSDGTHAARSPSRVWIWVLAVLFTLGMAAVAITWRFNVSQQLTREKLEAARTLWKARAPASYDLEYLHSGAASGVYQVEVRQGKIVAVRMKNREADPSWIELPARQHLAHGMSGIFDDLERFLEMDEQPDRPRAFNKAIFDPEDGHLAYFVRSVSRDGYKQVIEVRKLQPVQ